MSTTYPTWSFAHRAWHRIRRSPRCTRMWPCSVIWQDMVAETPTVHTHFYKWSAVKAHKQGGPRPLCSSCGEESPQ
jgi:hypothetical protein